MRAPCRIDMRTFESSFSRDGSSQGMLFERHRRVHRTGADGVVWMCLNKFLMGGRELREEFEGRRGRVDSCTDHSTNSSLLFLHDHHIISQPLEADPRRRRRNRLVSERWDCTIQGVGVFEADRRSWVGLRVVGLRRSMEGTLQILSNVVPVDIKCKYRRAGCLRNLARELVMV